MARDSVREALELIQTAGTRFVVEEYLKGRQTPVFFGSALANFGLEPFLRALIDLAPCPQPRETEDGELVMPTDPRFTAYVFKIQANMDPRHRDRIAFLRVCSGRFEKDMVLFNSRGGRALRASRPFRFFGRDRQTVTVAYAGDVIGLVNPGQFAIGDTLHTDRPVRFPQLPRFPAEHFGRIRLKDLRYKQFDEGMKQLEEEGLMQVFYLTSGRREPLAGVVGALQFDVIVGRLQTEYGVSVEVDRASYSAARWVAESDRAAVAAAGGSATRAVDREERLVLLFASEWELQYFERQHPEIPLLAESPVGKGIARH
jgi:peptide chain release factor 3